MLQALLRHINFSVVKAVIVASPGFVKDKFMEYTNQWAVKNDSKLLVENMSKFVLIHASSGFKHSLKEVLQDPVVQSRLADTKATEEVRALDSFYKTLQVYQLFDDDFSLKTKVVTSQNDPLRACYGEKHVLHASEAQAIEILLISDKLFRSQDVGVRKRYVKLVDDVREFGGEVKIFSSMHVSGEQLDQLTGVCAVLRYTSF
jgi:protein pelota